MPLIEKHNIYKTKHVVSFFMTVFLLFVFSLSVFSQQEKKFIVEGNKQYKNKKYAAAEKNYSIGLNKNKDSYKAS